MVQINWKWNENNALVREDNDESECDEHEVLLEEIVSLINTKQQLEELLTTVSGKKQCTLLSETIQRCSARITWITNLVKELTEDLETDLHNLPASSLKKIAKELDSIAASDFAEYEAIVESLDILAEEYVIDVAKDLENLFNKYSLIEPNRIIAAILRFLAMEDEQLTFAIRFITANRKQLLGSIKA